MANCTFAVPAGTTPFTNTKRHHGLAATAQTYYAGAMIGLNTSGNATKLDDTAALTFVGLVCDSVPVEVSSSDSAGDKVVEVDRPWLFSALIASAAAGQEGKKVYALYDNEVQYSDGTYGNFVGTVFKVLDSTHVLVAPPWSPFFGHGGSYSSVKAAAAAATTTLTKLDVNKVVLVPNTAAVTINLPAVALCSPGDKILFIKSTSDAYAFTLDGNDSETINGATTLASSTAQYDAIEVVTDGAAWYAGAQAESVSVLAFTGATGVNEIRVPTNLADALSIEDSAGDLIVVDTTTGTQIITVTPAVTITGVFKQGATAANQAGIKGMYVSGTVAVAVPTIADAESDEVAVDVSAMTFAPAVGDMVVAIPLEALPTDCLLNGAYVSATDTVTVSFGTKEGGAGVTGANKNFKFMFFDLT